MWWSTGGLSPLQPRQPLQTSHRNLTLRQFDPAKFDPVALQELRIYSHDSLCRHRRRIQIRHRSSSKATNSPRTIKHNNKNINVFWNRRCDVNTKQSTDEHTMQMTPRIGILCVTIQIFVKRRCRINLGKEQAIYLPIVLLWKVAPEST